MFGFLKGSKLTILYLKLLIGACPGLSPPGSKLTILYLKPYVENIMLDRGCSKLTILYLKLIVILRFLAFV